MKNFWILFLSTFFSLAINGFAIAEDLIPVFLDKEYRFKTEFPVQSRMGFQFEYEILKATGLDYAIGSGFLADGDIKSGKQLSLLVINAGKAADQAKGQLLIRKKYSNRFGRLLPKRRLNFRFIAIRYREETTERVFATLSHFLNELDQFHICVPKGAGINEFGGISEGAKYHCGDITWQAEQAERLLERHLSTSTKNDVKAILASADRYLGQNEKQLDHRITRCQTHLKEDLAGWLEGKITKIRLERLVGEDCNKIRWLIE